MLEVVVEWLSAALMAWAPPVPTRDVPYSAIATDIVNIAFDPTEPAYFEGSGARARTALLLGSFAAAESGGFDPAVVSGKKRGAGGALCMMQIRLGGFAGDEGVAAHDILKDRSLCIRVALHRMLASKGRCSHLRGADKLGLYTHGRCVERNAPAYYRLNRAEAWAHRHASPVEDSVWVWGPMLRVPPP